MKIEPKQGMIPPPPSASTFSATSPPSTSGSIRNIGASTSEDIKFSDISPRPSSPVAYSRPKTVIAPFQGSQSPVEQELLPPIPDLPTVAIATSMSLESNLVKSYVPSSGANTALYSPPIIGQHRKVTEVTTIKRQPKAGWL